MNNYISDSFESGFMSATLEEQIAHCDAYELGPLFLEVFRNHQPVLEMGCGSGRWCAWLQKHAIHCDGIDWSKDLCDRAATALPQSKFVACDMKETPFPDKSYGGIIALGSIEHTAEGPQEILREFNRIFKADGVAVITVPYGGPLRSFVRFLNTPVVYLKSNPFIRRLLGKPTAGASLQDAQKTANPNWRPRFSYGPAGWFFYEYAFDKAQMRAFLTEAGFEISKEFPGFGNEGIFHVFGRLTGSWNNEKADVDFTPLGKFLRNTIPVAWMGHMLCYVVTKKSG